MSAARGGGPWWVPWAGVFGAWVIRVLGWTWRIEWTGRTPVEEQLARGEPCIFAFWHARMLPLVFTHRDRGAAVLVSQSRDGELIARALERMGFVTARGSSTRGGGEGALEMLERAREGRILGITPDGPRGPAERVKPGLTWLASHSGCAVVPIATAANRAWVLRSWDGFRIPWPFARVCAAYGEPVRVPPGLDDGGHEDWRLRLEQALHEVTHQVDRRAGEAA